jgi:hypothetical protein
MTAGRPDLLEGIMNNDEKYKVAAMRKELLELRETVDRLHRERDAVLTRLHAEVDRLTRERDEARSAGGQE